MSITEEKMIEMEPEGVFEWNVDELDAGLREFNVTVGTNWTKSKKAYELSKIIMR